MTNNVFDGTLNLAQSISLHSLKSVVEQGFFHKFAFDNKALKTFVKLRIC